MQTITDYAHGISDKTNEQSQAAKQRFESFKLGAGFPSSNTSPQGVSKPSHGRSHSRSHSRNTSITSLSNLSNTASGTGVTFTNSLLPSPKQRPNSHHRRRSSVSTRRESAELMGVSVPDLPASKSDDNINLGDKDSIRRRALWALEGKPDVSYTKVEIPELASPQIETSGFNFPSKPSYPAGTGAGFNGGLSALAGKRDSMGKYMASVSSKDQLHTLVEEEEEEEDEDDSSKNKEVPAIEVPSDSMTQGPTTPVSFSVAVTKPSPARHRPASLNLRPLALTSGCIINPGYGSLPTPTLTPGTKSSGLKSLSLSASTCVANNYNNDTTISTTGMRRQSLILASSPIPALGAVNRRTSLNITCDSPSPMCPDGVKRQSSISYKSSIDSTVGRFTGLPTPEMTPVQSERKQLDCTADDELLPSRRLSASEQHFLFKSHNALLARITDLENALSSRSRSRSWSRPVSVASDVSSNGTSEPSDEMLSLIADLKAERDELKRDVDGWRTRVADLEDKVGVFAKRVEAERREAWVARSHLGLLEIEKGGLEKALRDKTVCFQEALGKLDAITEERDNLKADNQELWEQVKRAQEVDEECARLKAALEEERQKREDLEKVLDKIDILSTPTPGTSSVRTRRLFKSLDSEASLTDVEPCDDTFAKITTLKAVAEEEEEAYVGDDSYESDEDNGLAGYEDEEDSDLSFQSPDGSSVGSMDEYTRASLRLNMPSTPSLIVSDTSLESASPCALTPSVIQHVAHNSLSRTWTFPIGSQSSPSARHEIEEIDRFFGCLDDLDASPPLGFMTKEANGKSLFSQSLGSSSDLGSDDELPPFVLPSHVGVEVDMPSRSLTVVLEEEEEEEEVVFEDISEEFQGEEFEGGIRFTFNTPTTPVISVTPPVESLLTQPPLSQASQFVPFDDEEYEAEVPFTFSKFQSKTSMPASSSFDDTDSDSSVLTRNVSPSSIPRSTVLKSFTSTLASSTPTKAGLKRFTPPPGQSASAFITPPSKRGGIIPSFIPQPVASPSKPSGSAKSNATSTSTFIRQPLHKATVAPSRRDNANDAIIAHSRFQFTPAAQRDSSDLQVMATRPTSAYGYPEQETAPTSSFSSIVSLQAITNWWSPRPDATAMTSSMIPESSSEFAGLHSMKPKGPVDRKYVPKDKQLEKLRARLEQERRANRGHSSMNMCRTCGAGEVRL